MFLSNELGRAAALIFEDRQIPVLLLVVLVQITPFLI